MGVFKKSAFLVSFILLVSFVLAYSAPLTDFGFTTIDLNDAIQNECRTINLDFTDKNLLGVGILSINASFFGEKSDSSRVSVKINEGDIQFIWPEYFSCKENCWARVFLPSILNKKTKIELCLSTGGATTRANVFESSFVGFYDSPLLSVTNTAPESIILGEHANMVVSVKNEGTKEANVFVQFVSQDLRSFIQITSFDIVDGSSNATIVIAPGAEEKFSFSIKPAKASSYNLPYSIIKFENVFGETQTISGNHPQLLVLPKTPLEVTLVSSEVDKKLKLTAIIKNNLSEKFEGKLIIKPQDLISLSEHNISIFPGEEQQAIFMTEDLPFGDYVFSAEIKLNDSNDFIKSNSIDYSVKKDSVPLELVLAVLAIIVAVAVFFTINFVKKSKNN